METESKVIKMSLPVYDPVEHAHRILDVVKRGASDATSDTVAHSWARCVNEHRLDPSKPVRPPVLDGVQLQMRHTRLASLIDCARYEMTTLFQQLGDSESAVVLTDTDGVILHMVTSPGFEREVQPLGLEVGAVWSEEEAGTNGMGTCAAAAMPIAVCLDDHFFSQYTSLTCSAVPIYNPAGCGSAPDGPRGTAGRSAGSRSCARSCRAAPAGAVAAPASGW